MRLWSIHPQYLDAVGLVALWRESLLAQKVLRGETHGYKHHPQLERFYQREEYIGSYLLAIYDEAKKRDYNFDISKITNTNYHSASIAIPNGQLRYEFTHLMNKFKVRSPRLLIEVPTIITPHPLFYEVVGGVCSWER